jgi:hypothetical protein
MVLICWLLVLFDDSSSILADAAVTKKAVTKKVENKKDEDKCGIYLAQSTIPGAGYGYVHMSYACTNGTYLLLQYSSSNAHFHVYSAHTIHPFFNFSSSSSLITCFCPMFN